MANRKRGPRVRQRGRSTSRGSKSNAGSNAAGAMYAAGIGLLLVCVVTSLMLALEHIGGLRLPGCGEGSACAQAAASVWGKVPYINWPVSFVGVAYFVGMLAAWLRSRRGVTAGQRYLVRCGTLASLGFIIIMIVEGHLCSYCVATHAANIGFWIIVECAASSSLGSGRPLATVAALFIITSAALGMTEWRERKVVQVAAEEDLERSTAAIIAATSQPAADREDVVESVTEDELPVAESTEAPLEPAAAMAPTPITPQPEHASTPATTQPVASGGFTGRYRLGPEKAAIRAVMFSDYQCQICKQIETEVIANYERRDDMSVSFKHYPMCSECNRRAPSNQHPNACWAARAAETAGILRGNSGFWQMHFWLFEHGGSFTREQLRAGLRELGYDIPEFERVMSSERTLDLVKSDVEEAFGLGVYQTPSVFINGVELRGWIAPEGVTRAITELAATSPQPATAASDQPPPALEKLIKDWQAEPQHQIPPRDPRRVRGPETAAVQIVVFGDYQQGGTAEVDALIRRQIVSRGDIRYEYRHFPFNKDCNPIVRKETKFPLACRAAYAAEAAANLGGAEAFWAMHIWLLENQERFSDVTLQEAASAIGLDPRALLEEMSNPAVRGVVVADSRLCKQLGSSSLPTVFINGRRVPRWNIEEENILPNMIAVAAGE